MNFLLLIHIKEISPSPVLVVVGDHALSKYFGEDAYKGVAEPKELYLIPNAGHGDLYDKIAVIPFDKLTAFFSLHLNKENRNKTTKVIET